jgi:hypothetical protein
MTGSIGSFFGGGGHSAKFPRIGSSVEGVITAVNPPEQQTDPKTQKPVFKDNGQPKMQIRVTLQTAERDPGDPDDDGLRNLYIRGWMVGAIGDALRKAGKAEPEVGGRLKVTHNEEEPSRVPGFDPIKKYVAEYTPPAASGGFFENGSASVSAPAAAVYVKPEQISQAAWDQMDEATRKNVSTTFAAMATSSDDLPPF